MKLLITVLLSVLLIQCAYAQISGSLNPYDKPVKKASKIITFRYGKSWYNSAYPYEMDTTYRDTSIYNEQGQLTERHVKFGPSGHYMYQNYTYQYKLINGNVAERTELTADGKTVTTYTESGLITDAINYRDDGRIFKDIYTYDDKHNLVECESYNNEGKIMTTIFKYNKKHILEEKTNDGIFPARETYDFSKFDKTGNWAKCISNRYSHVGFLLSTGKPGISVDTETTIRQITYQQ